jgi:hypothetical protein
MHLDCESLQFLGRDRKHVSQLKNIVSIMVFRMMLLSALVTGSCTKPDAGEPVSAGQRQSSPETRGGRLAIDPDQIALPPKMADSSKSLATSTSKDANAAKATEASEAADASAAANSPASMEVVKPASPMPVQVEDSPAPVAEEIEAPQPIDTAKTTAKMDGPARKLPSVRQGTGPQTFYIKAAILTVRSQPNRYAKILGYLEGGTTVHVKVAGDWAKLDAGRWIRSRWLVKNKPTKFVGSDYRSELSAPSPRSAPRSSPRS